MRSVAVDKAVRRPGWPVLALAMILGWRVHQTLPIDFLLGAGLVLLLFSGLHDFAVRTVPNWVSLLLFAVGAALRLIEGGGRQWRNP